MPSAQSSTLKRVKKEDELDDEAIKEEKKVEALYAIRTLLCIATNVTPHESFFSFPRWSSMGTSLPLWLLQHGTVLRHHGCQSKHELLKDKVELIKANPHYA